MNAEWKTTTKPFIKVGLHVQMYQQYLIFTISLNVINDFFFYLHSRSEYGYTSLLSCSTLYPLGLTLSGKLLILEFFLWDFLTASLSNFSWYTFNCSNPWLTHQGEWRWCLKLVWAAPCICLISVSIRSLLLIASLVWHPAPFWHVVTGSVVI